MTNVESFPRKLKAGFRKKRGATLIEYVLVTSLLALAGLAAGSIPMSSAYSSVGSQLESNINNPQNNSRHGKGNGTGQPGNGNGNGGIGNGNGTGNAKH